MPHLHSLRWRVLLLSSAALMALAMLCGSARAATGYGELTRFGSEGTGSGELAEAPLGVGVDSADNSVFVVDEPTPPEQKKEHLPEPQYEECIEALENPDEEEECEVGVGPITRHFGLLKYTVEGSSYKFATATSFAETGPEGNAITTIEGIAIDPGRERLYLLTSDNREGTLAIDNSRHNSGAAASSVSVASTLFAFNTKELAVEGKGATAVLAGPTTLEAQSATAGRALLEPKGITVDPATHEVIVLAHVDTVGEKEDNIGDAGDHYVLQRIKEDGELGERYVDTGNALKTLPKFGAVPNSPIVVGPSGSERVLIQDEGLVEVPYSFSSSASPQAFGSRRRGSIDEGSLERSEFGGGLAAGPVEEGAPDGTIYSVGDIKNEADEENVLAGVEEFSGASGTPIGWTGGQQVTVKKKVEEVKCVIEPLVYSQPAFVGGGKENKVFVLASEFLLRFVPGSEGEEPISEPFFPALIEFGPTGTGCPEASVPQGITAEADGTVFPETTPVKAGTKVTLSSHIVQADSLSVQWEFVNVKTKETTKEAVSAEELQTPELVHAFEQPGEFEVIETIHTNDLASPELKATRKVLVNATKPTAVVEPSELSLVAGEKAEFKAKVTGLPKPTVQWQVSTNKGGSWTNVPGATTEMLTIEHVATSENEYRFRVAVSNEAGKVESNEATLMVSSSGAKLEVTKQPENAEVTEPATATFKSEAKGTPTPTVKWEVSTNKGSSWTEVPGATTDTLTVEHTKVSETGDEYRAAFKSGAEEAKSDAATLTVNSEPIVTEQPTSVTVTEPAAATFTSKASGTPAPTVKWEVSTNGGATWTPVPGAESDSLKVEPTTESENGYRYRAVFTNAGGKVHSGEAILTVEAPPSPPKVTKQPENAEVTEPGTATFKAEAKGPPTPTVQWEESTDKGVTWKDVAGATSDTLTIASTKVAESGNEYRAVFTNGQGSPAISNAATLTVKAPVVKTEEPPAKKEEPPAKKEPEIKVLPETITQEPSPTATIASTSLSVSSSGSLVVKVTCPAGDLSCTGTLTLRTVTAVIARVSSTSKKKPKPAILTLTSGSFAVAGGQDKSLTLHLSSAARALLAKSHGVLRARLTVVARDPQLATATTQAVVTLRAVKPKHASKH
jgi:hypothetical protein